MGKVIKNIERPQRLTSILLSLKPNESVQIFCSAYKSESIRSRCTYMNKKFGKAVFAVSTKGLTDSTKVTRLQ